MICKKCGRTMPPQSKICGLCGHKQGDAVTFMVKLDDQPPEPSSEKKSKKVKKCTDTKRNPHTEEA